MPAQSRAALKRKERSARVTRTTKETDIVVELAVDGAGKASIDTGVPFLNHMLDSFARHGFFDLTVQARGDLEVDQHHTVEDVGLALGQALREALGDKAGIRRFGEAACPLDEALVRVTVDLSGRPFLVYDVTHHAGARRHLRHRAGARLPARAHQPARHEPARRHGARPQPAPHHRGDVQGPRARHGLRHAGRSARRGVLSTKGTL